MAGDFRGLKWPVQYDLVEKPQTAIVGVDGPSAQLALCQQIVKIVRISARPNSVAGLPKYFWNARALVAYSSSVFLLSPRILA